MLFILVKNNFAFKCNVEIDSVKMKILLENQSLLTKVYTEDQEAFLTWSYKVLLGRQPDEEGLLGYMESLNNGVERLEILWQICQSSEFIELINPSETLSDEEFLRAAYRRCLLRDADKIGVEAYLPELKNMSITREELMLDLDSSHEALGSPLVQARHKLLSLLSVYHGMKNDSVDTHYPPRVLFARDARFHATLGKLGNAIDVINKNVLSILHTRSKDETIGSLDSNQGVAFHAQTSLTKKDPWRKLDGKKNLLRDALVVITGVPFDDVGGGQRAAQLARCALKTGRSVIFLYLYKKFDFELSRHVDSDVSIPGLFHEFIGNISPSSVLELISPDSTLLIELPHPQALPYLRFFKSRGIKTVFELIDDWDSSLGGDWFSLDVYKLFVAEADHVIGTAKILVEKLRQMHRDDAIYLPNAANEYIFDKYRKYERPADLPINSDRILLYFGSLYGEWFGWDYIEVSANSNPDIAFVLIGDKPAAGSIPSLPENVYFLGGKRIDLLPAYLANSCAAILPFVPGKISDAVSPIKVFEYLFLGVPVISTRLPEITDYPGVSIANSPGEFALLCKQTKKRHSAERLDVENDRFITKNSWFSRLDAIVSSGRDCVFVRKTSVIILIHNNASIIGRCLESLFLHCSSYLKEVIIVDNCSVDGGADFVRNNFPSVVVVKNTENGCSSGRNMGVKLASGEYLAFFDSDQWFTSSSCFDEALSILSRDANVGAVGWAAGWFDAGRDDLCGMIADYCPNRAMNDRAIKEGYRSDIGYLGTGGFFVPRAVFHSTEGFDVAYDPTCFEDTDMSFQIKRLGFEICYRDLTGIRHQPHQTTQASSGSASYSELFKRNAAYFKLKWSAYPNFFVDYVN